MVTAGGDRGEGGEDGGALAARVGSSRVARAGGDTRVGPPQVELKVYVLLVEKKGKFGNYQ